MKGKFFSDKKTVTLISAVVIISLVSLLLLGEGEAENTTYEGPPRAVIIDQLHDEMPYLFFQQKVTEYLTDAGYEVDVVTTQSVTVDFYKKLPELNYEFIVVRTHAVGRETEDIVLFTGEKYQDDKYIQEQLFGHVKKATPVLERSYRAEENDLSKWNIVNETHRFLKTPVKVDEKTQDEYFAISSKLVDELMVGNFPGTTILLGGCGTLANPSMAQSFINRGATTVVGWDDTISNFDNDEIMLRVLKETFVNDLEIKDAVDLVMENYIQDKEYPATFKYYSEKNF